MHFPSDLLTFSAALVRTSSSLLDFLQLLPILRLRFSRDYSDPIVPSEFFLIPRIRPRYTLALCAGVPFRKPEAPSSSEFTLDYYLFDNRPSLRTTESARKPKLERNPYFLDGRVGLYSAARSLSVWRRGVTPVPKSIRILR